MPRDPGENFLLLLWSEPFLLDLLVTPLSEEVSASDDALGTCLYEFDFAASDSACHDANTCAHLASANDTNALDVRRGDGEESSLLDEVLIAFLESYVHLY
jgi:hypothetical protein